MGNQKYKPKSYSHIDDLDRLMTAMHPKPQPLKKYTFLCDIGARR